MNRFVYTTILFFFLGSVVFFSSCSTTRVEREIKTDQLEDTIEKSRHVFHRKELRIFQTEADFISRMLTEEKAHASYPLYLCENASFYLLLGNQAKARQCLEEASKLQDILFDKTKEKQASSIWGNESDKVYKGEPYERAVLYLLYGTCLLNDGEIDNALACFKRSLLVDADGSETNFHSDFPLPMILAAKCIDLQQQIEERDLYLRNAVNALVTRYSIGNQRNMSERMRNALSLALEEKEITPYLQTILSWGNIDSETFKDMISAEERSWLKTMLPPEPKMDFNTVVFIWNGRAPWFSLAGNNHFQRNINVMPIVKIGGKEISYQFYNDYDGTTVPVFEAIGDISYQAITQGCRQMEMIQKNKSNTKDNMENTGDILSSATLATIPYVGMVTMAIGSTLKELSKGINAEADIRSWQCLPREFYVAFLNLPSGESIVEMQQLVGQRLLPQRKSVRIRHHENSPLQVVHIFPTN